MNIVIKNIKNIDIRYHEIPDGLNSSNAGARPSNAFVTKSISVVAKKQVRYGKTFFMFFSFTALFENRPVTNIKTGI